MKKDYEQVAMSQVNWLRASAEYEISRAKAAMDRFAKYNDEYDDGTGPVSSYLYSRLFHFDSDYHELRASRLKHIADAIEAEGDE